MFTEINMHITDKYTKLFEQYWKGENEYLLELLSGGNEINYPFGYLFGKLTERDKDLIELINDLKQRKMLNESFRDFVVNLEVAKNKKESTSLIEKIKEFEVTGKRDYISLKKLEFISAFLKDIDFNKIINYYKSIYTSPSDEENIFNCTNDEYVAFKIIKLLYEYYNQSIKRFVVPENNNLENLYTSKGISLKKVDAQYSKYQLLTISDDIEISDSNIPKVYDKRIKENILINEISIELLKLFKRLMGKKIIGSIALRPEYSIAGSGIIDLSIALEELERGEIFSLGNLGFPTVSKLYSKQYDNLWVVIDERNITFEEIIQDFHIYNDSIVTQVVHLEYEVDGNSEQLINHIDHEYIFYTVEEYEIRQKDYKQKGNAIKRYKTFKIDDSKIPFYVDDKFVLYYIIEKYFRRKELLKEYFEDALKTSL